MFALLPKPAQTSDQAGPHTEMRATVSLFVGTQTIRPVLERNRVIVPERFSGFITFVLESVHLRETEVELFSSEAAVFTAW